MTFLKNIWYVAANANELDDGMVSRKICNEQVLMYRTSNGDIAALEDRCPHRFVPLSLGKLEGDTVRCNYHGLRFDAAGACVEAPNDDDSQKARACIKAYTAVQRYAVIWLWMGDAKLADPALIPEFDFLSNTEKFGVCQGYTHLRANYQLIADNLLDLSHVHYLHPHIHSGSDFANFTNKLQIDGETVWSMLYRHHYYVDKPKQVMYGFASEDVEGQGHSRWNAPGVLLVETALWEHGKTIKDGIETPSAHLLTPETEFTSHYFWGSGRTFDIHNEPMSTGTAAMMKHVFETQDGPMVEAQQASMGATTDFLEHKPIILKADAAGVAARRVMKRKLAREANGPETLVQSAAE